MQRYKSKKIIQNKELSKNNQYGIPRELRFLDKRFNTVVKFNTKEVPFTTNKERNSTMLLMQENGLPNLLPLLYLRFPDETMTQEIFQIDRRRQRTSNCPFVIVSSDSA